MKPSRKPMGHISHLLKSSRQHQPNFTLFLGAGASVESGIPTAGELIETWRGQFEDLYPGSLEEQHWFDSPSEYSQLFEALYDHRSHRRELIEECVEKGSPSWGYFHLVNLMAEGLFNTVLTTNFDDLLNESCFQFSSDVRPIVCAHDSSVKSLRLTSRRPKIIKLHGDFLFDSIKNTVSELESLEDNMRDKFRQFAREFGMIVVGYSGNDRSIMETLSILLKDDENFPGGIYWCVRPGDEVSGAVNDLLRFNQFKLVEITGFNEFMVSLHHDVLGKLPLFDNPYQIVAERFQTLVSRLELVQNTDEERTSQSKHVARSANALCASLSEPPQIKLRLPFNLLAWHASQERNSLSAIENTSKYLLPMKSLNAEAFGLINSCLNMKWDQHFFELCVTRIRDACDKSNVNHTLDLAVLLIRQNRLEECQQLHLVISEALQDADTGTKQYSMLNELQIKARQGVLNEEDMEILNDLANSPYDFAVRFGVECFRGGTSLRSMLPEVSIPHWLLFLRWPIADLLPVDIRLDLIATLRQMDPSQSLSSSFESLATDLQSTASSVSRLVPTVPLRISNEMSGAQDQGEAPLKDEPLEKIVWPSDFPSRAKLVETVLKNADDALSISAIDNCFKGGRRRRDTIIEVIETLTHFGAVQELDPGLYSLNRMSS